MRSPKRGGNRLCAPPFVSRQDRLEEEAAVPIILWLLGVPLSVIIVLWLIGVF